MTAPESPKGALGCSRESPAATRPSADAHRIAITERYRRQLFARTNVQQGNISKADASTEAPTPKGALVWNIKQQWVETRALAIVPIAMADQRPANTSCDVT